MAIPDQTKTTGVVLAAGNGSRLGRGPKALLPYHGRPLVEAVAAVLLAGGCREVVLVLGAGASHVVKNANLKRYRVVVNGEWRSGMGSSLKLGNASAPPKDHLMIALVDQPGITPETVERLLNSHRLGMVTAATYEDAGRVGELRRGHPMLIDTRLRNAVVETVVGDAGARRFLQAHPVLVHEVDCSDQSSGQDIDTPEHLHLLR